MAPSAPEAISILRKASRIGPVVKPAILVATTEEPHITMLERSIRYELIPQEDKTESRDFQENLKKHTAD
jgi:hypothetical protein